MPYCKVGRCKPNSVISAAANSRSEPSEATTESTRDAESISIFYQRYGHGPTKVLLIIGLAGTHESWGPQLVDLCGTDKPNETEDELRGGGEGKGKDIRLESRETGSNENSTEGRGGEDVRLENRETGSNENSTEGRGEDIRLESRETGSNENSTADFGPGDRNGEPENTGAEAGNGIEVCAFDNRGAGKSSIPLLKSDYTTKLMAEDALALMDHLGWEKAHICGHSMGGMIACKMAALAPHRVSSLALIGVTGGGYQCLPKLNKASISLAYRLYLAKTPEERSLVDLETHYTHEYLESTVGETTRRALLFKEYVNNLTHGGMQPRYGLEGQAYACWHHSLSSEEIDRIRSAEVIVAVIHGRLDVIAQVEHARSLAKKLVPVSRMIELNGGHLVTHQNRSEVNGILLSITRAVNMNIHCTEFQASEVGLYSTRGGECWQTTDPSSAEGVLDQDSAGQRLETPASDSVLTVGWRKVLPDWIEMLYITQFLHWISRLFGIDRLWESTTLQ